MSQSLLQRARTFDKLPVRDYSNISDEQMELALAYLIGEVSWAQCSRSIHGVNGTKKMGTYVTLLRSLRKAYQQGYLKIK